jgi:hypothetical protein
VFQNYSFKAVGPKNRYLYQKRFEKHNWAKPCNLNLLVCRVTTSFSEIALVITHNAAFHLEFITMMRQVIPTLKITQKNFSF